MCSNTYRHLEEVAANFSVYNADTLRVWLKTHGVSLKKTKSVKADYVRAATTFYQENPTVALPSNKKRIRADRKPTTSGYTCTRGATGWLPLTQEEGSEISAIFDICDREEEDTTSTTVRRPLNPEEVQLAQRCLQKEAKTPDNKLHWSNICPTPKSLATLQPGQWLDDDIINFYMYLLVDRSSRGTGAKLAFGNTHLVGRLQRKGDGWAQKKSSKDMERWAKWCIRKVPLEEVELLLVPVHLPMHWVLFAADFAKSEVYWVDSLHNPSPRRGRRRAGNDENSAEAKFAHATEVRLLTEWFAGVAKYETKISGSTYNKKKWDLSGVRPTLNLGPSQPDGTSCGVYTCVSADYLALQLPLDYKQEEPDTLRGRMAIHISRGFIPCYCAPPAENGIEGFAALDAIPAEAEEPPPNNDKAIVTRNQKAAHGKIGTREYYYDRQNYHNYSGKNNQLHPHYTVSEEFVNERAQEGVYYRQPLERENDRRAQPCPNRNRVAVPAVTSLPDEIIVYPAGYKPEEDRPVLNKFGRSWWGQVLYGALHVTTWNSGNPPSSCAEEYQGRNDYELGVNDKALITGGMWYYMENKSDSIAIVVGGSWIGSLKFVAPSVPYMTPEEASGAAKDHELQCIAEDKRSAVKAFKSAYDECYKTGWQGKTFVDA